MLVNFVSKVVVEKNRDDGYIISYEEDESIHEEINM